MRILYIVHPSRSHINAGLNLLTTLQNKGHEIGICAPGFAKDWIENFECKFFEANSYPFGSGFEKYYLASVPYPYISNVLMRFSDFLFHKRKKDLIDVVQSFVPTVIILDILYATDLFVLFNWVEENFCKVLFLVSKPSLNRTLNTPPVNSGYHPKSITKLKRSWWLYNSQKQLKRIRDYIIYFSFDDLSILKRKIKSDTSFQEKHPVVWKNFVGTKFANIPELVLLPEEYEFQPFEPLPSQHYVGFQLAEKLHRVVNVGAQSKILKMLKELKSNNKNILYCSFGTIYELYVKQVVRFLKELFIAVSTLKNTFLIVSFRNDGEYQFDLPANAKIFSFVPQLDVLKNSDLFITHGGINSIKESIHFRVPMLVYPGNPNWDQKGNAARLVSHQMGLRGDMQNDDFNLIRSKILQILDNQVVFKSNIDKFKKTDLKYNKEYFLNKFYALVDK